MVLKKKIEIEKYSIDKVLGFEYATVNEILEILTKNLLFKNWNRVYAYVGSRRKKLDPRKN